MSTTGPRHWYRRHGNNWIAMVTHADDGTWSVACVAESGEVQTAPGLNLEAAQRSADAWVPLHECDHRCSGWFEGQPPSEWLRRR